MTSEALILNKIYVQVHEPLNYDEYDSTMVRNNTNCFSHAIGTICTMDPTLFRPGRISGLKSINHEFVSIDELRNCFLSDLKVLDLSVKPLQFDNKVQFLTSFTGLKVLERQHVVVQLAKIYSDERIHDFHFLRYDPNREWTEKVPYMPLFYVDDIDRDWPDEMYYKVIGAYLITR